MAAPVIMAIGDSVTLGVRPGVTEEQTFLAILGQRLGCRVINRGVGGEGVWAALGRASSYRTPKPDVVLIMYGINDAEIFPGQVRQRDPLWDYEYAYTLFLQHLIAGGPRVILMTPTPWGDGAPLNVLGEKLNARLQPYAPLTRSIATKFALGFVDHWSVWAAQPSIDDLQLDQCHPNPAGHRLMADTIEPVLRHALGMQETK